MESPKIYSSEDFLFLFFSESCPLIEVVAESLEVGLGRKGMHFKIFPSLIYYSFIVLLYFGRNLVKGLLLEFPYKEYWEGQHCKKKIDPVCSQFGLGVLLFEIWLPSLLTNTVIISIWLKLSNDKGL